MVPLPHRVWLLYRTASGSCTAPRLASVPVHRVWHLIPCTASGTFASSHAPRLAPLPLVTHRVFGPASPRLWVWHHRVFGSGNPKGDGSRRVARGVLEGDEKCQKVEKSGESVGSVKASISPLEAHVALLLLPSSIRSNGWWPDESYYSRRINWRSLLTI